MEMNNSSDLIQGTLQSLLQNRKEMEQRQQEAQSRHLDTMRTPLPQIGPVDTLINDYLQKYGSNPGMGWNAMASAAGSWQEKDRKAEESQLLRQEAADKEAAKYATDNVKEDDLFGSKLASASKVFGKQPTPEQLRTVYTGARNEAAQIAKDYQFGSAEERSAWIEQQANAAVENYIQRYAMMAGAIYGQPGGPAPTSLQPTPAMPTPMGAAPQQPQEAAPVSTPGIAPAGRPPLPATQPSPAPRDKAEEERRKTFANKSEELAIKDYDENVKIPAQAADSMLNTVNIVRQIPRTQDMFAPYREKLGATFQALGLDGKMVNEAQSIQQVRPLLAKIANDRLLMAKGVQTEGDAQRAYNEFVKITDTQAAADFMYAWTEELANRAKFKDEVYRRAAENEGTMQKGKDWWGQTDYSQTAPVALLNGKPYSYTSWRNAFLKRNPDASLTDAVEQWNKLTRGGK